MHWSHYLILVTIFAHYCGAASSGLLLPPASQTSATSVLSTNYCLRRRALQPGVRCEDSQSATSTMPNTSDAATRQTSTGLESVDTSSTLAASSSVVASTSTFGSDKAQSTGSSSSDSDVGVPGVTPNAPSSSSASNDDTKATAAPWSPAGPSSTPAITSAPASATSEVPWIPTLTSGSITVETVTYSFNLLVEPPPRSEKDGKSSSEQVHLDFLAVIPKINSAASIFDGLGSAFKSFSSAVRASDASDKSVSAAGSGLLGLFHNAFSGKRSLLPISAFKLTYGS